jgi:DNA-binding transcriptional MocR family regulator
VAVSLQYAEAEYARRRRALIDALAERGVQAFGRSGLNVWIPVGSEHDVVVTLRNAGLAVMAGERFRRHTPRAIRVTVAGLATSDAGPVAAQVATAIETAPRPRHG